ncbi:dehydrogenase [Rothia nasimurium]|uniref:dehydrogenase n=1 Tax=Rothia nasimurium TaxID=85336 RepID=UPI003BA37B9E
MGIKDFLQGRRDDAELGKGLWRRAHDRFVRGLDRFHQILERVPEGPLLEEVIPLANELADVLPRVRAVASEAHKLAPSEGNDVPASPSGVYSDLHRSLSKAGNALALCAEALAMTRCSGTCEVASGCSNTEGIARRVEIVLRHIEDAEARLGAARQEAQVAAS